MRSVFWGLLVSSLLACISYPPLIWAADPVAPLSSGETPVDPTTPEGFNNLLHDPNYADIDHGALYGRANENISIQAGIVEQKAAAVVSRVQLINEIEDQKKDLEAQVAQLLNQMNQKGQGIQNLVAIKEIEEQFKKQIDKLDDQALAAQKDIDKVIGDHFCKPAEGETNDQCNQRFLQLSRFQLVKFRAALGKNSDNAAQFECAEFDSSGKCIKTNEAPTIQKTMTQRDYVIPHTIPKENMGNDVEKLEQATYFSKYDKLREGAKRLENNGSLNGAEGMKWINEFEPKREDFVKFVRIPRDPKDPSLGFLEVATKQIDMAAFKRAHDAWAGEAGFTKQHLSRFQDSKHQAKAVLNDMAHDTKNDDPDKNGYNRLLYNQVRGSFVDQANENSGGKGKNLKKNMANVGGKKQDDPPKYTGDENIQYKKVKPNERSRRTLTYSTDAFTKEAVTEDLKKNPDYKPPQKPADPIKIEGYEDLFF